MSRLDVNSGEIYTVDSGETEEWFGADVDGTLEVNGTLELIDDPDTGEAVTGPDMSPVEFPLQLDLPSGSVSFRSMATDTAIFFIGFMGLLGAAGVVLKNYVSIALVAMAVIALILAGTMNMGIEIFYGFLVAAALMLAAGVTLRGVSG